MRYTVENTVNQGIRLNVFVNGNKVDHAIMADTTRGEVLYCPLPFRPMKGKRRGEVYTRMLRGTVTVEVLQ